MKDINDFSYTITNWDNSVYETDDVEDARLAVRDGREVLKTTRRLFRSGPALVRLYVTVKITKIKDL
ncbi:MAG: hypothetical protein FWH27_14490 [Planctomycetaceae bacterium]|nr:hypothetical protein [Planctomycetaceae bacterium]